MTPARRPRASFRTNVFINCPFDAKYLELLRPLLFTLVDLGFTPRIASERSDSTENRADKIIGLIRQSRLSIHDISRLRASAKGEFSRFNLPFELGLAHASRVFGPMHMRSKRCLILETDQHQFRRALSDLAGVDIKSHGDEPRELVRVLRDWLVETVRLRGILGPSKMWYRFNEFMSDFDAARAEEGFSPEERINLPIPEYIDHIRDWVANNPANPNAPSADEPTGRSK